MKFYGIFLLIFFVGCAHLNRSTSTESLSEQSVQEAAILKAQRELESGKVESALQMLRVFQNKYPQSIFFQSARLSEGEALERLSQPREALEVYRSIFFQTEAEHGEIAALALYRMAFAYEALGDDLKMVASLLDAKKRGDLLPIEIAAAQIPAKLAVAYARQNHFQESLAYLNDAEKGLSMVMSFKGKEIGPEWLAKIYFEMGSVSSNQLSLDNFDDFVRAQKVVQVYLLKSLKQNDPFWSARSLTRLQETYRDLDTQLGRTVDNREVQIQLGGSFVDLMNQAELFRPLIDQPMNTYENKFYNFLSEIRKKTEIALYRGGEQLPLTEESQRLHSLKRPGQVQVESYLPEEKKSFISLPPKVVPTEDPNLSISH